MTSRGSALFDTAIGRCGIAWGARGVTAVQLPERDDAATRGRLPGSFPESDPPPEVRDAIEEIRALLRGERRDLAGIVLDLDGVPEFHRRVYAVARTIPPGSTTTYGDVARRLGMPG